MLELINCNFKCLYVLGEEYFSSLGILECYFVDNGHLGDVLDDGQGFLLVFNFMIKLRKFFCVNHGDDCKNFIIFQVMKVAEYNLTYDVILECEF